jgi:prephenate dehydrogenase
MPDLNIGFIGLGLIGGSIAKSIRRTLPSYKLTAWCRKFSLLEEAKESGIIDFPCGEIDSSFSKCDYIFLCTPVDINSDYLHLLKKIISKTCIITDVGSVKSGIHNTIRELDMEKNFIGGHPMAGSEKTGFKNATSYLFENAYYAITPTDYTPEEKVEEFKNIISKIGGIPLIIDYSLHDYVVAESVIFHI